MRLPLPGDFQVSNALVAAGLVHRHRRRRPTRSSHALQRLEGAPGRLERVGEARGAGVFVDYAHKPDALEKALAALRPYVRGRLIVVFGCGGDRDAGKRPIMGEIATRARRRRDRHRRQSALGEPRGDPRRKFWPPRPGALEIGDRAEAIRAGVAMLKPGDALMIAGKGHETGQIVGERGAAVQRRGRGARGPGGRRHERALDAKRS